MALLLFFAGLLPVAVAPLAVLPAGLARRAGVVALPRAVQLVSLVSVAALALVAACHPLVRLSLLLLASEDRLRGLGGLLSLRGRHVLVRGLDGVDRLGGREGKEVGVVLLSLLVVLRRGSLPHQRRLLVLRVDQLVSRGHRSCLFVVVGVCLLQPEVVG